MHALSSLAGFRRQGRAPALPVLVTDLREPFTSNLTGCGAMVIEVWKDAHAWNWSALAGLEVILAFRDPSSDWAKGLALAIRDARPRDLTCIDWSSPMGERMSSVMP
jgi:type 1 fimbria pilin